MPSGDLKRSSRHIRESRDAEREARSAAPRRRENAGRVGPTPRTDAGVPSRPYHHGDLRDALIAAALTLVETHGPGGFTLREAARVVGVTHAAPYRHFADKQALLAAVAQQGFDALHDAMSAALTPLSDPLQRLHAAALAYVRHATAHQAHFRVMQDLPAEGLPAPVHSARQRVFTLLVRLISDGQRSGAIAAGEPKTTTVAFWAAVHGCAELLIGGRVPGHAPGHPPDASVRDVVDVLLRGLTPRAT